MNALAGLGRECSWCGKDITGFRVDAIYCSSACRSAAHKAENCFYCGMPAAEREHIIPLNGKRRHNGSETVPTCYECNRLASNKIFDSVDEKREFIQGRILTKYDKILKMPDWTEEEIEELGHALRSLVKASIDFKQVIYARVTWDGKSD